MPTSRASFAAQLQRGLAGTGLLAVLALTLVDRGATRMYATPWNGLLGYAQLVPLLLLLLRLVRRDDAVRLPPRAWQLLAAAGTAAVLASALASPFRGPSVGFALLPLAAIATFLLLYDWTVRDPAGHPVRLQLAAAGFSAAVVAVGSGLWLRDVIVGHWWTDLTVLAARRNAHPLGHSNYAAGLALLALPWLGARVWQSRGPWRLAWWAALLAGIVLLVSSGSRGGMLGLCVLLAAALYHARPSGRVLLLAAAGAVAFAAGLMLLNPRTRTLVMRHARTSLELTASTAQRTAMLQAGWRLGRDRPTTGWGPGTTPLVYPRYRAGLDGGVEDALQLHSTPIQIWADTGAAGVLVAGLFLALALRSSGRHRGDPLIVPASVSVAGYAAFALFDFQLDVPVFLLGLAAAAALLAAVETMAEPPPMSRRVAVVVLAILAVIAGLGRRDPTPAMNVRALALARDPARTNEAIALLQQSLAINPTQEIAHFNLGWLLLVRAPQEAARHFRAAAVLVPDKGGVYFGLALARRNEGLDTSAARALALECLNDPLFLTSPWWRQPEIAQLRPAALQFLRLDCERLARQLDRRRDPRAHDARWVSALADWLDGTDVPGEMLGLAHTSPRVQYFVTRPARPDFAHARVLTYRRERTAYPVLMRRPDLPPPHDLFDVQENELAAREFRYLFPPKGWLPADLLRGLPDAPDSAKP